MNKLSYSSWQDKGIDVEWMLLSFLSLGAGEQASYFKHPLVNAHDLKKLKSCATNPVSGLIMTFEQRVSLFEGVCDEYNDELIEAVGDIKNFMIEKWNENESFVSRDHFLHSTNWKKVREDAKQARKILGLGVCRVTPRPLDFNDFIEIVE